MGDGTTDGQSKDPREAVRILLDALNRFNEQIDITTEWIGTIPALPSNEVRQVVTHVLEMSVAFIDQSAEAIAMEQISAQKHIALAVFDCVSVLNRFHFVALHQLALVSKERHATITRHMLSELERLSKLQTEIPDPPSQQWGNLPANEQEIFRVTKADKDLIDDLALAQQQIARDLEALYRVFENHFGPELLKEIFEALRAGSALPSVTGKNTSSEAELFFFSRIILLLEATKKNGQNLASDLDKFGITIDEFKDWARETRRRV